ncbi:MAG TPA: Uma2 family endonuclease [Chloroflexota bacterium]|nr:Uma2 family endonuclease [Chloroflexota bacterium]
MAVLPQLSDLDQFLLTTPSDTEEAPWMVMADLQVRDIDLLKPILREYIEQQHLPWYLASYLKISRRRPDSDELLEAAPDLMLALGEERLRTSWSIEAEGSPLFVLEVASTKSLKRDYKDKPRIYGGMGVAEYAIFAPERKRGPQLSGYRRDEGGRFIDWRPDHHGVLWSRALGGLGFFVEERLWLRALDAEGQRLPTPQEQMIAAFRALQAAEQRADAEAAARAAEASAHAAEALARAEAEAEVARLREELRRLRAAQEKDAHPDREGG